VINFVDTRDTEVYWFHIKDDCI